jgi:hypothetical protein
MTELRREVGPFRIVATGVTEPQLDAFAALALRAWQFVPEQIGTTVEDGWPTDWPGFLPRAIDVTADESISIPGIRWGRQQILFSVPAAKLRNGRDSCVAHELTHLLAPGFRQPDRMLAEGLAVHLQALFDVETGDRSYPTDGEDLHDKTRRLIAEVGYRIPLREAETARERADFGVDRQLAYLQEGSFVRFLIERHGMATYLRVHDGEGYGPVLGRDLDALEQEWASFLGRSVP